MRPTRATLALTLLLTGGFSTLAADEAIFRELTLDQAISAVAREKKQIVLIDFFTTWCEPCKKLDQTTWKDADVRKWLGENAVCLKIDAEKQEALASTYRINAYPTILLLKPDGTEVDRLVGYRDPARFLSDAKESLTGNDELSRARQALHGENRNNPMLRQRYGDALLQKGRTEDALSEYLWCFDHGLEHSRSYLGVRLSFLLSRIVELGSRHKPALDELRNRRDAARKAIEAGKADLDSAMGFTAINNKLDESDQTLTVFDSIKADKSQPPRIRAYLLDQSLEPLLKAKRYRDVVREMDVVAKVRDRIALYSKQEPLFSRDARLRESMKKYVNSDVAKYYEALIGHGNKEGAAHVAAMLFQFDLAGAYPELIAAAKRAGDQETVDRLTEDAKKLKKE
jgi:thiol-disulfide isomerase/thioredoxin